MSRRWILGGTTEGRLLAEFCGARGIEAIVSVATEYGGELVEPSDSVRVVTGRMDGEQMVSFIEENGIDEIIDATHPYAAEVTENARGACERTGISYIRCVRTGVEAGRLPLPDGGQKYRPPGVGQTDGQSGAPADTHGRRAACNDAKVVSRTDAPVIYVESPAEAVSYLTGTEGPVLLLTGSKTIGEYTKIPDFEKRLYARILPEEHQLAKCRSLGLAASHLICMQGPFSCEMNAATIRQTGAKYLVTKESGAAGGFLEKLEAAALCGVTAVVIGRAAKEEGLSLEEVKRHLSPERPPVCLVGIGMGGEETLTVEARRAIRGCGLLVGAERMVRSVAHLAPGAEQKICYLPDDIVAAVKASEGNGQAAVLFSGDTGFYSGAARAAEALRAAGYSVRVFPGISSLSCLAAKIQVPWEDAVSVSLHGREADPAEPFLGGHKKVFYLLDKDHRAGKVLGTLAERGFGKFQAAVGERLSGPEEKITVGAVRELAGREFDPLAVLFVFDRRDQA